MKRKLLLWLFGLLLTVQMYAQNRTISGTVKDAKGEALIGVNVTGKGTTIGTVTDIDGKYTLELPKEVDMLVFSYVGYTTLEKAILSKTVDATLNEEGQVLEDIVVTSVAIKREKRSTSYSANTVKSDDLNQGASSVFSALQSKTPGVRITNAGGAVGSSTRVILDAEASFTGSNNALIVIDGIPVNNKTSSGTVNDPQNAIDFGNRGNDFDPDNIESVTVLKGPAATALYGSRAASGVLMITTKSGKSGEGKKFNVSLNSGVMFDKAYLQIKRQDKYGQGYDMAPDPIENFSWGPAFDGVVRPWTPAVVTPEGITTQLIRPYSAVKNQLQDAFNTGVTYKNGINIEGADDKYNYFLSYINTTNKGIFDNTFYKRHAVTANMGVKFSKNFTSRVNVQYSKINQRVLLGAGTGNFGGPFQAMLQQAVNIPIVELRDYNNIYQGFAGYYGGYTANPFYLLNNMNNDSKVDNLLASAELEFKPVDFITLTARIGDNYVNNNITIQSPKYQYAHSGPAPGGYAEIFIKDNNITADLIGAFSKTFKKKYAVDVLGGFNYYGTSSRLLQGVTTNGLVVPGFYDLSNSKDLPSVDQSVNNYRIIGLYGQARFSYDNLLFLEYQARNDWSSTLPAGKNGFFYQSGGISFVPTEFLKGDVKKWLNYAKIRFNVGTQGKDAATYQLNSTYSLNPVYEDYSDANYPIKFPFLGQAGATTGNQIGNPNLKPEFTLAYEAGVDLNILKEYVYLEYTFRHRTHKDLIIAANLPASSGYTSQVLNIGKMRNVTHDVLARVYLLKNIKKMTWETRFQFSKTFNTVLKVNEDADEVAIGGLTRALLVAKEGMPFNTFKVYDFERDPNGNIIVGANGAPVPSSTQIYMGSASIADYTMGFGSTFSWNGLSADVQFDLRKGTMFYSGTKNATDFNGTSLSSLLNDRQPYIIPGSVVANGDGTFSENTTAVTNTYNIVSNMPESTEMIDGSYIKLREASLSYTFNKKFFKNTPISSITVGVIGRNLKFWLPAENIFADPESNSWGQAGNVQGIEFSSTPSTRSFGFDFKIKF